jgi:ferrous iron transport protein A
MVIKPLSEMEPREKGKIVKVGGGGRGIRRRLLDMGVVTGVIVEVQRVAPLGDPVEIRVRGYNLALRKEEAADIQVELTEGMLSMAAPGETVTVSSVRAGWGLQRRLVDLGLTPGASVTVVSGGRPGPLVLDVHGSKLELGYGVARKIMVIAGDRQNK